MERMLANSMKPKEVVRSVIIEQIVLKMAAGSSYRAAVEALNECLMRNPDDEFKAGGLQHHAEAAGTAIQEAESELASKILHETFDDFDELFPSQDALQAWYARDEGASSNRCVEVNAEFTEYVRRQVEAYNTGRDPVDQITDPEAVRKVAFELFNLRNTVYIEVDDVGVKHQKATRKGDAARKSKYVENTVIHVEWPGHKYTLTAVGMTECMRKLLAFLVNNDLLKGHYLCFFSDGASNIRAQIEQHFSFCRYTLNLDWYHLEKRMRELLSMAIKGPKDKKEQILDDIRHMLWAMNVAGAIAYLRALPANLTKSQKRLDETVGYLERKRPFITCSALRKLLRLRNSSNPAEKANDILVARRQKHNGMSWSYGGSGALASITALVRNHALSTWIRTGTIPFSPVASVCAA